MAKTRAILLLTIMPAVFSTRIYPTVEDEINEAIKIKISHFTVHLLSDQSQIRSVSQIQSVLRMAFGLSMETLCLYLSGMHNEGVNHFLRIFYVAAGIPEFSAFNSIAATRSSVKVHLRCAYHP